MNGEEMRGIGLKDHVWFWTEKSQA